VGGVKPGNEIPLLTSSFYLLNDGGTAGAGLARASVRTGFGQGAHSESHACTVSRDKPAIPLTRTRVTALFRDTGQVGSLAGAAYLLHNNAGVLSEAQCEQKSRVEHKGKSLVDSRPSVLVRTVKAWPSDPLVPNSNVQGIEARGDRKITTGITGLWQPSVHSDVAF